MERAAPDPRLRGDDGAQSSAWNERHSRAEPVPAKAGTGNPNRKLKAHIDLQTRRPRWEVCFPRRNRHVFAPPVPTPMATKRDADTSAEDAARSARTEALERRRYGRASLIATSYRGLLTDRIATAGGGKNLLGE